MSPRTPDPPATRTTAMPPMEADGWRLSRLGRDHSTTDCVPPGGASFADDSVRRHSLTMLASTEVERVAERKEVLRAPRASIQDGCTVQDEFILVRNDGRIAVAPNRCRHQGGTFRLDDDGCLVCPRHGWRLDPNTMRYVSPAGILHPTFDVEEDEAEIVATVAASEHPWADGTRPPSTLRPGELTVRFLAHACAEIRCGSSTIVTDPWLVGPAFTRGWWLAHQPPVDWIEALANATAVYISHSHSDHLSPHTLEKLAAVRPDIPVFVPNFGSESCERRVRQTGLRNIVSAPFGEWLTLDSDTRFMILLDAAGREDSGLLIDYCGHSILNTVDCSNLNDGVLPSKVDVLLSAFAGAASGYPVCWTDLYPRSEIERIVARNRATELVRIRDLVRTVNPEIFVPFAGYFTEAHPADADVRGLNVKNTPQKAIVAAELNPGTRGWLPVPGAILDFATGTATGGNSPTRTSWDEEFSTYITAINSSLDFAPLRDLEGVQQYFNWVGFRGDLVLHVIETDEYFESSVREFFVDFRSGAVSEQRPAGLYRYLRMRVRATSFRHVLRIGDPWEELSIGFQARFYREPDQYNFDFWDHMQNRLPDGSPWPHELGNFDQHTNRVRSKAGA